MIEEVLDQTEDLGVEGREEVEEEWEDGEGGLVSALKVNLLERVLIGESLPTVP